MNAVSARAPAYAKTNLTLHVRGRRKDGFHELHSLVVGVDLRDEIRWEPWSDNSFEVTCSNSQIAHEENLAWRAAKLLARASGCEPSGCLRLDKRIPIGAGLGGGSSDAATALRLCNDRWGTGFDEHGLARLGADLGSDVALFFSLPAAIISGRGEIVRAVSMRWSGWMLMILGKESVSTPSVYAAWEPGDVEDARPGVFDKLCEAKTAEELQPLLFSDLERAVFRVSPRLRRLYQVMEESGVGPLRVSGAGSTFYRLFDERSDALSMADRVRSLGLDVDIDVVAAPVGPGSIASEES